MNLKAFRRKKALVGPMILDRCKVELGESRPDNVVRIAKAGVRFCIGDGQSVRQREAPVCTRPLRRQHGVWTVRRRSRRSPFIPAELLGIADRVGSIEPGKDAESGVPDGRPVRHGEPDRRYDD